jgi:SRR1
MPRKKKPSTTVDTTEKKKTVVHTKRKEILDDDGWTHIVDAPNRNAKAEGLKTTPLLHGGDFLRDGVSYINRTLDEMKTEFEYWKKQWEASPAWSELKTLLAERQERRQIDNFVFLGMGSLQNSRREGRRASATQLAALQTIISVLGSEANETEVVLQDPQFTDLDGQFLSVLGYKVVQDPVAFMQVNEMTLVYAIHCYVDVYKTISAGPRPAILIGTDVGNFGRFES